MSDRTFYASTYVVADGVTRTWPFSFAGVNTGQTSGVTPYLYPEDVKVQEIYTDAAGNKQTVQRTGVLNAPNQLTIDGPAIIAGREIRIYRETELRFPLVDYRDLQSVSEHDLDLANRQAVFIAQETRDTASANLVYDKQGHFNAGGRRIVNMAPGIDDRDAVNMDQHRHTLRIPVNEPQLAELPRASERAGKILTFDDAGLPNFRFPTPQSALELEMRLARPEGAYLTGWSRSHLRRAIDSVHEMLDAQMVNLWEFAEYVTSKPDPEDPDTWDWTDAIQEAIKATQDSGWQLYIPRGRYHVSRRGTVVSPPYINLPYAVMVTGKLNIVNHGTIVIPMDNATKTIAFVFDGVTGGGFTGGFGEGTIDDLPSSTLRLYNGALVLVTRSTGVTVSDIDTTNVGAGCIVTNSYNCRTRSCRSRRTTQQIKIGAAFGVYSSRHCGIEDCSVYGGTNDGDISLYGTGFYNYVSGCKLLNYYEGDIVETVVATGGQGLCVDAGQFNASVRGNFVQGYYYGIDVKSGVSDVEVTNNRCVANKVGIACRRGEVDSAMTTCRIVDNTVIPRDGNGSTGRLGGYTTIGIFVYDAFGVTVDNNFIGVSPTSTSGAQDWCGLYASLKTPAGDSDNTLRITNNRFTFHDRLGLTYAYNLGPVMRIVGDSGARLVVKMIGNTFRLREGAATSLPFDISAFNLCEIKDNNLTGPNSSVYEYFRISDGHQLAFNGNSARNVPTFLSAKDVRQVTINSNIIGVGLKGDQPFFKLDNCGGITVNGNSKWTASGFTDGKFLEIVNQAIVNLMFTGNTIKMSNATKANYYSINGEPGKTGDNIVVSNVFNPT